MRFYDTVKTQNLKGNVLLNVVRGPCLSRPRLGVLSDVGVRTVLLPGQVSYPLSVSKGRFLPEVGTSLVRPYIKQSLFGRGKVRRVRGGVNFFCQYASVYDDLKYETVGSFFSRSGYIVKVLQAMKTIKFKFASRTSGTIHL